MINLKLLSKHRDFLFGLAIISILIFHFSADVKIAMFDDHLISLFDKNLNIIQNSIYFLAIGFYVLIRSIGVEIFLLLSGMGLYWSYEKDQNVKQFYKRRCNRILAPYLITAIPFWIIRDFVIESNGIIEFIKHITFIALFTEGTISTWYAGFAMFTYLIYPLLYYLLFQTKHKNIIFLILLASTIIIPVFTINISFVHNAEVAILRIPIFLIGCRLAPEIKNERKIDKRYLYIIFFTGLIIKLIFGFYYIPPFPLRMISAIWSLSLLAIFLIIANKIEKRPMKPAQIKCAKILKTAGFYSFELYLIHVCIRNILKHCGIPTWSITIYFTIIILTFILTIPLQRLSTYLTKKVSK